LSQSASEGIRKNINSFFDDLGGDKTNGSTSSSGIGNTSTSTSTAASSGDVHPDAKKAGTEIQKGVDSAGQKLDQMMNRK